MERIDVNSGTDERERKRGRTSPGTSTTGLLDVHGSTHELSRVESSDGSVGFVGVLHCHKGEPTRVLGVGVPHDLALLDLENTTSSVSSSAIPRRGRADVPFRTWQRPHRDPCPRPSSRDRKHGGCFPGSFLLQPGERDPCRPCPGKAAPPSSRPSSRPCARGSGNGCGETHGGARACLVRFRRGRR